MKRIKLPEDISRSVNRRITVRVAIFIALLVGEALLFYFTGDYLMNGFGTPNTIAIFIVLTLAATSATGVFKIAFDRPWQGEIIHVYIDTVITVVDTVKPVVNPRIRNRNQINIVVRLENGIKKNVIVPNVKIPYEIGDTIYHFRGVPYNLVLKNDCNKDGFCVICGAKNTDNVRCGLCGHTIIK